MVELYQKVSKTIDNLYGIKECKTNPFLEGPCLLCISAQPTFDRSVFGIASEGMRLAGLRTSETLGMGYDIKSFPVKFLAMKNKNLNKEESILEFVNTYLVPLISKDNQRISYLEAINNMRQVNIMTYCNGAMTYLQMELFLREKMSSLGYSNQEIIDILSQCAFIAVGTNSPQINYQGQDISIEDSYATAYQFLDIADGELREQNNYELLAGLVTSPIPAIEEKTDYYEILDLVGKQEKITEKVVQNGNKALQYHIGSGSHTLKQYTASETLTTLSLSMVVSSCLLNSLKNKKNGNLSEPLRVDSMVNSVNELIQVNSLGTTIESLFAEYRQALSYPGTPRYSTEECQFMSDTEKRNNEQQKLNKTFDRYYANCSNIKEKIVLLLTQLSESLDKELVSKILKDLPITIINLVSSEKRVHPATKEQIASYEELNIQLYKLHDEIVRSLITNASNEQAYQILHDTSLVEQYSSFFKKGSIKK